MIDGARIVDGGMLAAPTVATACDAPRAYLLGCYPSARIAPIARLAATAPPMVAEINHGIWIARCDCGVPGFPRPGTIVFLDCPRGWCVRCGNQAHGGGWRPIVLPPADERARIEAVLVCRPHVDDRNWTPGETVDDLVRQNLEHGDPVPEDLEG